MIKMIINQNSEFLFGFEAVMTNPNGDPDQENKPRMDYETSTVLVSDERRKRDVRDFLKAKGFQIFVDTLADKKVPMDKMFEYIYDQWLSDNEKVETFLSGHDEVKQLWDELGLNEVKSYEDLKKKIKDSKRKDYLTQVNNSVLTHIIKTSLIDIRLFGSAMAVEDVTRTYTGPIQIAWGYSLHPVQLVKSNTITSIMNDDASTFGKKHKLYYAFICHYGTINKFSAKYTGMTEEDREIFRKSLVQGMLANQTDSKQGQIPAFYLEIIYKPEFDGFLGDLRRFLETGYNEEKPIRSIKDIKIDFSKLSEVINQMKEKGYIDKVIGWFYPFIKLEQLVGIPEYEYIDLWEVIK